MVGARLLVLYYVEMPAAGSAQGKEEILYRLQVPILSDQLQLPLPAGLASGPATDVQYIEQLLAPATRSQWLVQPAGSAGGVIQSQPAVVARQALHFGAWISTELNPRLQSGNWTTDTGTPPADIPPTALAAYSTQADPAAVLTTNESPFPSAVLFTVVLSSGRFAPVGGMIADLGGTPDQMRIGGISSLPVVPGAKLRIGSEWVQYSGYSGGVITLDQASANGGRAALRSSQSNHQRDEPVRWGSTFSLGRIFPH